MPWLLGLKKKLNKKASVEPFRIIKLNVQRVILGLAYKSYQRNFSIKIKEFFRLSTCLIKRLSHGP